MSVCLRSSPTWVYSQYLVMVGKVFHPSELLPMKWWWKDNIYFFCLMIPSESFISSFWKNLFCCLVTGFFVVPSRLFKTAVKYVLFTWENGNTFPCCSSVPLWVVGILRHKTRTWVWYSCCGMSCPDPWPDHKPVLKFKLEDCNWCCGGGLVVVTVRYILTSTSLRSILLSSFGRHWPLAILFHPSWR